VGTSTLLQGSVRFQFRWIPISSALYWSDYKLYIIVARWAGSGWGHIQLSAVNTIECDWSRDPVTTAARLVVRLMSLIVGEFSSCDYLRTCWHFRIHGHLSTHRRTILVLSGWCCCVEQQFTSCWLVFTGNFTGHYQVKKTSKKRSERHKHYALAVVRRSQKSRPTTDPFLIWCAHYELSWQQSHKHTHKHTHKQTTHIH